MISNLKTLRQAANLTQKELAEKTGVSQQKISELERNVPSYVEAIVNICSAVGCTFEELFGTTTKLNRPTTAQPTADRCDTATSSPVQDNDQTSVISNIFGTFVKVPVEKVAHGDCVSRTAYKSKKYYVQLKSIEECRLDPDCKADVEKNGAVYGIKKEHYEELAARPAKALYDGVRFYVADDQEAFDFSGDYNDCGFWYVAPRFVKCVWEIKSSIQDDKLPFTEIPVNRIEPKTDYYIQLKSIQECREDPECKEDVEKSWVYGISTGTYKELTKRPIKAHFDGVRFLIGDTFGDVYVGTAWRLAPKFIKQVWTLY